MVDLTDIKAGAISEVVDLPAEGTGFVDWNAVVEIDIPLGSVGAVRNNAFPGGIVKVWVLYWAGAVIIFFDVGLVN